MVIAHDTPVCPEVSSHSILRGVLGTFSCVVGSPVCSSGLTQHRRRDTTAALIAAATRFGSLVSDDLTGSVGT